MLCWNVGKGIGKERETKDRVIIREGKRRERGERIGRERKRGKQGGYGTEERREEGKGREEKVRNNAA